MYEDRGPREEHEVTCADCGVQTTVPFKPTGDRPVKCRDCVQKDRPPRRDGGGGRGAGGPPRQRIEYEVTCAECGAETTVPFEPRGDRPVKCRDCFQKDRGGPRSGGRGDREMHDATCSRCSAKTQVPFRPTPGREVLCNDCFRR